MKEPNINPFLQFDFKTGTGATGALRFSNPVKTIIATDIGEVTDCLQAVEAATKAGYYAAGYVSYEATHAFYPNLTSEKDNKMPLLWFGIFEQPTENDAPTQDETYQIGKWNMNETKQAYEAKFQEIMTAIRSNTIEQINYTIKFKAAFSGNPYRFYLELKQAQQSDFSAYLHIGNYQILSASPELFFKKKESKITLRPMKGTIHRGKTFQEDEQNKTWLQTSQKNQFENKLTTDVMMEELKAITTEGSLAVTKPFQVEKYPTVYQMTSTITGEIASEVSFTDIIQTLFPCGSIAGKPKQASMELITTLEKEAREVYCGAIGYITPDQEAVFNVPIRTVVIDQTANEAEYGAGGAITRQSQIDEEFHEVLTKAKILHLKREPFELLETLGLYEGQYLVYEQHLTRLMNSAAYFNFRVDKQAIEDALAAYTKKNPNGNWIVRLTVPESGDFTTEIKALQAFHTDKVTLARTPIDKRNVLFYHKTTHRSIYDVHLKQGDNLFDVLLWNEDGEITEFTIGNIVIESGGELITPPLRSGVLPGTFRQQLLDDGKITERVILISDLQKDTKIWLINSVRQWVEVDLIDSLSNSVGE